MWSKVFISSSVSKNFFYDQKQQPIKLFLLPYTIFEAWTIFLWFCIDVFLDSAKDKSFSDQSSFNRPNSNVPFYKLNSYYLHLNQFEYIDSNFKMISPIIILNCVNFELKIVENRMPTSKRNQWGPPRRAFFHLHSKSFFDFTNHEWEIFRINSVKYAKF